MFVTAKEHYNNFNMCLVIECVFSYNFLRTKFYKVNTYLSALYVITYFAGVSFHNY